MGNLTAIIAADTTGFKKSVEDAKKILEQFTKAEDSAINQIKEASNVSDSQVAAFNRVTKTLSKVSSGAMSTAQAEKALSAQVKELKIQYANLSEAAKQSDFGKAIKKSCEDAEKYLGQVRTQLEAVKDKTEETTTTNTKFGNVLGNLKGVLGTVGVALGAATTAQVAFEKAINSNQTTADGFASTMEAAKTSVNQFFYAITTGDFSVFNNGLNNLISRAREAAAAIDQLGNTLMSYNVINAKAQSKITAAKAILYDPDATEEEKKKAEADIRAAYKEIEESSKIVVGDFEKAIITEVEKMSNISLGKEGAIDIIDKWLEMDATKGREEAKRVVKEQYAERDKALKDLERRYTKWQPNALGQATPTLVIDDNYNKELAEINEKYKDAVVANTLIEKYQDDQLDNLGKQRIAMIQYADAAAEYAIQAGRVNKALNGGSNGGSGGNKSNTNQRVPLDLSLEPINIGRTEKQIKDEIKTLQQKIENTPDGVLRIALIAQKQDLEKELKDFGKNPIQIDIETKANNIDLSGVKGADTSNITNNPIYVDGSDAVAELGNINDAAQSLYSTFKSFEDFEDMDFGEQFFTITDAIFSTIDAISRFGDSFTQLIDLINTFKSISQATTQQKIALNQQEASSNMQVAATEQTKAFSGAAASGAKLPFPANLAAIAASIAAVVAALSMIGRFENGGIVQGSRTIGDMNIARVNSGEMILNGSQQKNLFNLLDGGMANSGSQSGEVHFKIQGKDLVGVLSNYNTKVKKVL